MSQAHQYSLTSLTLCKFKRLPRARKLRSNGGQRRKTLHNRRWAMKLRSNGGQRRKTLHNRTVGNETSFERWATKKKPCTIVVGQRRYTVVHNESSLSSAENHGQSSLGNEDRLSYAMKCRWNEEKTTDNRRWSTKIHRRTQCVTAHTTINFGLTWTWSLAIIKKKQTRRQSTSVKREGNLRCGAGYKLEGNVWVWSAQAIYGCRARRQSTVWSRGGMDRSIDCGFFNDCAVHEEGIPRQ